MIDILYQYRFVPVIALLVAAAVITTPPNRLPLALRGLRKMLGRGSGPDQDAEKPVTRGRRLLACMLVLLAFLLAVF